MKFLISLIVTIAILCSINCDNLHQKAVGSSFQINDTSNNKQRLNLLDSIKQKFIITHNSIRKSTIIDSAYIIKESIFQGDTVLFSDSQYCFAIILYDDRLVCSLKFLLVFDRIQQKNTDYKMISNDCDRPEGESYEAISYKILNDSSIIINHNHYQKALGTDLKLTVDKEQWRLGENGVFYLL